jgi:hypothetical protein
VGKISNPGLFTALLIFGLGLYLTHFYFVPNLVYQEFAAYRVSNDEQILMIVVKNQGQAAATRLRISIEAAGEIKAYSYNSPEETMAIEEDVRTLVLNSDRLVQGTEITIYIIVFSDENEIINRVTVTSDQGVGRETTVTIPPEVTYGFVAVMFGFFALMGFMMWLLVKHASEREASRFVGK